jgi:pimeloyl-ACP methyl ester carboxylesterase
MVYTAKTPDATLQVSTRGEGPALVFIHGWAASQKFWQYQARYFAARFRAVTYDLRGHADSEKPLKGYTIPDHVRDLVRLIGQLRLSAPILVGHSFGGMIALQYALDHPKGVKALVLVGTSPRPVPSRWQRIQMTLLGWVIRLSRARAAKMTKGQLFAPGADAKLVEWVNTESLRTPTRVVLACLKAVKRFNVSNRIGEIAVPTLLVRGEYDKAASPALLKHMVGVMPHATRVVVNGAGHNCMLEQPSRFNAALDTFLDKLAAQTATKLLPSRVASHGVSAGGTTRPQPQSSQRRTGHRRAS